MNANELGALVRYGFVTGSVVASATSDDDGAPAKPALGGETTNGHGYGRGQRVGKFVSKGPTRTRGERFS